MPLKIYNTLSREKEEFVPITPGKIGMYVCGVTVYDECHLGHARALINFDVIYRYLKSQNYEVNFVRNFTDVDDKIIVRAQKDNAPWNEVSEKYIGTFHRDMEAIGNLKPTLEPKATEHITEMLDLISRLEKKEMAYPGGSDVFYAVRKKSDYGKLSGKKIEELEAGARIEIQEAKKDPLDFALWKGSKPGEPAWDSPWGKGRPGWHIECSAMSMKYLGETFDIHGGGRDLSFPHHENEIAQSEGATGKPFAKYWIHNGFVNINSQKMSKSLGNFLTIRELTEKYPAEVLRLFILSAHYRSPIDYTSELMESTRQSLMRWYQTIERIEQFAALGKVGKAKSSELQTKIQELPQRFQEAMDDDFNTAKVTGLLFDLVRDWNKVLDEKGPDQIELCSQFLQVVQKIHGVLGIFGSSASKFLEEDKTRKLIQLGMNASDIEAKLVQRLQAKQNKDFKLADSIRDELLKSGIQIKDAPGGKTVWSVG